ncbi:MAG: hypothetical protein P4M08_08545 [Oligoflexia bacterium]|nr:hypothetical protein [Oligoflexia bacterium]
MKVATAVLFVWLACTSEGRTQNIVMQTGQGPYTISVNPDGQVVSSPLAPNSYPNLIPQVAQSPQPQPQAPISENLPAAQPEPVICNCSCPSAAPTGSPSISPAEAAQNLRAGYDGDTGGAYQP